MKLRALTIGIQINSLGELQEAFLRAAVLGSELRQGIVEANGLAMEVQTVRIATNPFEEWIGSLDNEEELAQKAASIAEACESTGLEFVSLGPATTAAGIRALPTLLKASPRVSASAALRSWEDGDDAGREGEEDARRDAVVATMAALALGTEQGLGNFRFAAGVGIVPNTPFFPVAYHDSRAPTTVSIGTENSDEVVAAFAGAKDLTEASTRLEKALGARLLPLEALVQQLLSARAAQDGPPQIVYGGIDTSINPSLGGPAQSLVRAYESFLGKGRFGQSGTVAVSEALTRVVSEGLPSLQKTGFCGLMLPAMEDHLLAARASQEPPAYGIQSLLMYSAVCGVGVDTVPVSLGDVQKAPERVKALLADLVALSRKKGKPLACRLFPVPGGEVGDMTTFDSPYLCNSKIFALP